MPHRVAGEFEAGKAEAGQHEAGQHEAGQVEEEMTVTDHQGDRQAQPLSGLRVLECGDTVASAYAGRLLTDLGADVVVVERIEGHPLRGVAPHLGGSPGVDRSAAFACFGAGKRSVCIQPADSTTLPALVGRADVVIRSSRDGVDLVTDDELSEACAAHPGLIVADVSTFGRSAGVGPHATDDLIALAASGLLSVNSTAPCDTDATPLRYRGELSSIHAGCGAVLAVLGALFERRASGRGQHVDVSSQAAVAGILATAVAAFTYRGEVATHDGARGVAPWGFYTCRDGEVLLQVTEDSQFRAFVAMLGDPAWGSDDEFATTTKRSRAMDVLDPLVAAAIADRTVDDFLADCHAHGIAAARIHSAADVVAWDHLRVRGSLREVVVEDDHHRGDVLTPGPPWRYTGSEPLPSMASPRLGSTSDLDHVWGGPRRSEASGAEPVAPGTDPDTADTAESGVAGPLAGIRVVDLTWVWAGPYAAMQLAHLGAEVVKIESSVRADVTRLLGPWADKEAGPNRSGYFNQYNLGKQSALIDLSSTQGREVLGRLLECADVVIDNMRAGALDRMGFSYEELRVLNPRLVAVSMTGFGETGPERDRMAYGSLIDALSGVASANGAPGGGPTDFSMSLPDPTAGIHAAIATVAALYRARETGRGERVECSMLEATIAAFPWPVLYQGVLGHGAPVHGNRDDERAPHDVYRCHGTSGWVAISVRDDDDFAALTTAVENPDLATDPRFATMSGRRLHADALDAAIEAWTVTNDRDEAARRLAAAGVPAEAVARIDDVVADDRLRRRGFLLELDHPEVGTRALAGPPWRTSRSPMGATTAAPCLGEHTAAVLERWLGLDDETIEQLERNGVLR